MVGVGIELRQLAEPLVQRRLGPGGHQVPRRPQRCAVRRAAPRAAADEQESHASYGVSVRVLIFTADIGAGHDLPARLLEEALEARGAETVVVDAIEEAGGILKAATRTGAETVMRRLVAEHRPDVVVSTYPGATEILGHMRATGELAVPVVAEITDLASLQF